MIYLTLNGIVPFYPYRGYRVKEVINNAPDYLSSLQDEGLIELDEEATTAWSDALDALDLKKTQALQIGID